MTTTLDIVTLRSLVAVAACGGFHKAAHALHLTQATVSRHVQRLEDGIGAELITPDGRGIKFTAAGERMLTHATAILEAHDEAVAEFVTPVDTLTIGAMDHAADLLLPGLVEDLRAALPHKTIQVRLGRSARLREAIANNQLDAALVLQRITHDPTEPGAIPTQWVAAQNAAQNIGTTMPIAPPVPLVLFDHHCGLRTGALKTLDEARIRYTIVAEAPDLAGVQSAARAGIGITLLPRLGRVPDKLQPVDGLPQPPGVVVAVQTATHVTTRDAKTIRKLIATRLDSSY
ncbi:LysR substrate-binding domain-containing protein [Streptomyces natalensis]|uniref:LysR substrate-binding domain-containing protein n=1 Tax=Streptomyces natalensis TaxID=68242 RepID=UPI00068F5E5C|nr:LysR substrate-binding domain-containing protein [Streptomyces natalensis]